MARNRTRPFGDYSTSEFEIQAQMAQDAGEYSLACDLYLKASKAPYTTEAQFNRILASLKHCQDMVVLGSISTNEGDF